MKSLLFEYFSLNKQTETNTRFERFKYCTHTQLHLTDKLRFNIERVTGEQSEILDPLLSQ